MPAVNAKIRTELDEPADEEGNRVEIREATSRRTVSSDGATDRRRAQVPGTDPRSPGRRDRDRAPGAGGRSDGRTRRDRRGLQTLVELGRSEATTFVLPQELTTLLGRYGTHLTGSGVADHDGDLENVEFDAETRALDEMTPDTTDPWVGSAAPTSTKRRSALPREDPSVGRRRLHGPVAAPAGEPPDERRPSPTTRAGQRSLLRYRVGAGK